MDQNTPQREYKPNIYPIMYWALLYGMIAASALLVLHLLDNLIGWVWFPVFLAGVVWGGFRKYQQDKAAWAQGEGIHSAPKTPVQEFKDAARDIAKASGEMITRQAQEDAAVAQAIQQEIAQQEGVVTNEQAPEEQPKNPQSPIQPLV